MIRLAHPNISKILEFRENVLQTLIVESQPFFRELTMDLLQQIDGHSGKFVLSEDMTPIKLSKFTEVITQFFPFDANRKTLLTKIGTALEKQAISNEFYVRTQELLASIEKFLFDISFDLPSSISFEKVSPSSLIKAFGIHIPDSDSNGTIAILNYMDLVRELEDDKLFIFINMRCFFSHDQMSSFVSDALLRKFNLLLIDNKPYPRLPCEEPCTIDINLCEF